MDFSNFLDTSIFGYHVGYILNLNFVGISGEKVEIDPVSQPKVSAKFWVRQRAVSYDTDCIVACDLIDTKSNSRAVFR